MQRQKRVKPQITSRSLEDLNPYKYCTLEFIDTYIGMYVSVFLSDLRRIYERH